VATVGDTVNTDAVAKVHVRVFGFLDPGGVAQDVLLLGFQVQWDAGFEECVDAEFRANKGGDAVVCVEFEEIEERF